MTAAPEADTRPPAEPPLVEPGMPADWWEETPAQAARADRKHWNRDED